MFEIWVVLSGRTDGVRFPMASAPYATRGEADKIAARLTKESIHRYYSKEAGAAPPTDGLADDERAEQPAKKSKKGAPKAVREEPPDVEPPYFNPAWSKLAPAGATPAYMPPEEPHIAPRRTAEEEALVREGHFTYAKPEPHPDLDEEEPPLDEGTGAGMPQVQWGEESDDEDEPRGRRGGVDLTPEQEERLLNILHPPARHFPAPGEATGSRLAWHDARERMPRRVRMVHDLALAEGKVGITGEEAELITGIAHQSMGGVMLALRRAGLLVERGEGREHMRLTQRNAWAQVYVAVPFGQHTPNPSAGTDTTREIMRGALEKIEQEDLRGQVCAAIARDALVRCGYMEDPQ